MIARKITSIVKASCSGAVRIKGMVVSLPPLPALPHLGPVAAKLSKEENINFIVPDGLEKSCLKRALGL